MKRRALTIVTLIGVVLIVSLEFAKGILSELFSLSHELLLRIEIGSIVLLILIVLNLLFHFSAAQAEEAVGEVTSQLSLLRATGGRLAVLSSSELYKELVQAANSSRHRIYSSYLGPIPPSASNLLEKHEYFKMVTKLSRKKRGVLFRRIILLTKANYEWINSLMKEYTGQSNVSLAVYVTQAGTVRPLSVQLFDDAKAFIIHAAVRPPGQPRDIELSDPIVVSLLDDYYDELWANSHVILDSGRPDSALVQRLSDLAT